MASYLITGSSRGLGLELATQLASSSEVGHVFATGRQDSSALKELMQKSNGRVTFVHLDATNQESIKQAVTHVEKVVGGKGLDVLINNAGVMDYFPDGPSAMTADVLDKTLHTNVTAVHLVIQGFLPLLEKGNLRKIVNISSTMGSMTLAHKYLVTPNPAYKISKAALNMLTVQYAHQYAKENFTIFCISPGWMKTDMGSSYADLKVEEGARAVLEKVFSAGPKDNGSFMNIRVEGWEDKSKMNYYDGENPPW